MSELLSGKIVRESRMHDLQKKVMNLGFVPRLAIVQVGNREDSSAFIKAKINFGKKVGVETVCIHLKENISENKIIEEIKKINIDKTINAIIVQLPLPIHIDRDRVVDVIGADKDADALSSICVRRWQRNAKKNLLPATARGVRELLKFYKIGLNGKQVTIVGRSKLVGKPTAVMCRSEGAKVTVCHSKTKDIPAKTFGADIVIMAVGKAKYFGKKYFSRGQVVVDVGINTIFGDKLEEEMGGKRLVGDVDFDIVKDIVGAISPVPGGVGPMTVLGLFENVVDLCSK